MVKKAPAGSGEAVFSGKKRSANQVQLKHLSLRNYRNYENLSLPFYTGLNVIHGRNAQGKTNLLEAIYLVCGMRPFSGAKNSELVRFGCEVSLVKGEILSANGLNEVHVTVKKEGRHTRLNSKTVRSISQHFGRFKVVLYLPSDIEIVKGGLQARRNYLDSVVSAIHPVHIKQLRDYQRAVSQRNHMLGSGGKVSSLSVEPWDEQIARIGADIVSRRIEMIKSFNRKLAEVYGEHGESDTSARVSYGFSFERRADIGEGIREALSKNFPSDRKRGHTTAGSHRDRVGFLLNGRDASRFASQGQSKNLVLALKASEIRLFKEHTGTNPILLLDDITSELDIKRRGFLFKILSEFTGQVFVTSTDKNEIPRRGEFHSFLVDSGRVKAGA